MADDKVKITTDSTPSSPENSSDPSKDTQSTSAHDNPAFTLRAGTLDKDSGSVVVDLNHGVAEIKLNDDEGQNNEANDAPNLTRDRPFSASMASRRSTGTTKSRVSVSPSIIMTDYSSKNLFSYKDGMLEQALYECKKSVIDQHNDGEVKAYWLLTEIDHWDFEKERFVILTDNSLLIVKFDFIKVAAISARRIYLNVVEELVTGDITYPSISVMPSRDHGALKISWSHEEPSFGQRWNPWCQTLPYIILTHHLLRYNKNENETVTFSVDDLADTLEQAVNDVHKKENPNPETRKHIELKENPITIETYANITTVIYNQSKLGFNLERGGVSY